MCFGLIAMGTASAISAVGSYGQGRAANKMAKFNAREISNQRINDQQETAEQIRRTRIKNRKILARRQVGQVKSNLRIDVGSPIEELVESAVYLELEVQDQSRALQVRDRVASGKQALSIFQGKSAKAAGNLGALAHLAGGSGSIFSTMSKAKQKDERTT